MAAIPLVRFLKEVFIDHVRGPESEVPQEDIITLLLDSGGGNNFKIHITLEAFLLCKANGIDLFY